MAFHEIAVDPSVIRSLRDFQLVWSKAGFSKGRLIAGFPERGPDKDTKEQGWAWRVVESVKAGEIGSAKRVQAMLETYGKFKMLKRGRMFDHGVSWNGNAEMEHRRLRFAALIASGMACDSCCCSLDDLEDERCPACLRDDQHVMSLPKQPADFADSMLPMLRCAKELRFVDPYFLKCSKAGVVFFSKNHGRVVQEIANRMKAFNRVPSVLEFHMRCLPEVRETAPASSGAFHMAEMDNEPATQLLIFAREMEAHLPKTWKARAYLWKEKLEGRRFHARYILTDVGGAGSEYGWDQGNSRRDQTDLYLLTESLRSQRIVDFSVSGDAFTLAAGPHEFPGIRE